MDYAERIRRGSGALGHPLAESAIRSFEVYLEVLRSWNERINLTALTDPDQIIVYHFLDSLSALSAFSPKAGMTIADLGSGAGFPGVVIQIACPGLQVTLVESSGKKVAFLHYLRGALGLEQLEIQETRMEQFNRRFDLLISRAVAPSEVLRAAPAILKPDGEVILFLKENAVDSIRPLLFPSWALRREIPVILPFVQERRLVVAIGESDTS
jgi:16S rRNA (guanine527-N7)-methyltransferase